VKEYTTPESILHTEVKQTDDWRWGDHVPFLDDYLVGRSRKFVVERIDDLAALRYLLVAPKEAEIRQFRADSQPVLEFARERQLLVTGGWGVGADLIGWVYGLQNMVFATYDQPDLIRSLLELIAEWNQVRMRVVLETGVDLYIKRTWYENCDFWTPGTYEKFIYPILKDDVDLAHQFGAKFGCLITSNAMPLLDLFVKAGVDVLIGVDPHQWDLELTKQTVGDKLCLWGGVNGHLTIEQGTPQQVRHEVRNFLEIFTPGGGFILSPVDNVREATPTAKQNVLTLIDAWREWQVG
jgi:uroporphyrinogen-III decarboxylase